MFTSPGGRRWDSHRPRRRFENSFPKALKLRDRGLSYLSVGRQLEAVICPRIDMKLNWHSGKCESLSPAQILAQKQIQLSNVKECLRKSRQVSCFGWYRTFGRVETG